MEDTAEKGGVGVSGSVYRVMPTRDRVRALRREGWWNAGGMLLFVSFAGFMMCVVPYSLITGKPTTVNGTVVRGWSSVNADVIMFQCVAILFFGIGMVGLRRAWISGREDVEAFPHAAEREWRIHSKDHQRMLIVDGFGISEFRRRLSVGGSGPSPKRVVLGLPSPHIVVTIDGEIKADLIINPSSENSSDQGVEVDIEPGAEAVVFARVDRARSARRNSKWTLGIGLLGDPEPPEYLLATWSDEAEVLQGNGRSRSTLKKMMGGAEVR